ncbi:MAG: hypothetical protein ACRDK2_05630 [Solirubrobacteraceae bacterium]
MADDGLADASSWISTRSDSLTFPSQKSWVTFWRSWAFPIYLLFVWRGLRRNRRKATNAAEKLGETAAKIVIEAQDGSRVLRRLTYAIVLLTLLNTGFVIYSVLK